MTPREPRDTHAGTAASPEDVEFAREMLPLVSRTFAPAIDILPGQLADQVRLAYLICRVADTVEDATGIPAGLRRSWLTRFAVLLGAEPETDTSATHLAFDIAAALRGSTAEVRLVEELPRLVRLLRDTDPDPRRIIERWSRELSLGMARFLILEERSPGGWTALGTMGDLDAYEYYVAGTVGSMLHELIASAMPRWTRAGEARPLAVSFGLGLQEVNILQDMSVDRARGWSYVPEDVAKRHGTTTDVMHLPAERDAAMGAVAELADRSAANLDSGLEFVVCLPRWAPRVRLFCLWPLVLALRTLSRIVSSHLVLQERVRITREEVRELTREAIIAIRSDHGISQLYSRERRRIAGVTSSM